jgi:hypothetical protein
VIKPHALLRLRERGISVDHIEAVVKKPVQNVDVRFGRRAVFGNVNRRHLLVIYQTNNSEVEVVTALWIRTEDLRKYGFSRI